MSNRTKSPFFTRNNHVKPATIDTGSTVIHKKFGKGKVIKIDKNAKFIHIEFTLGKKKFIFPDAFVMGFLEVEN